MMAPSTLRHIVVAALSSVAIAVAAPGCYVETEPVYAEGYRPAFYDGYVVYYDGVGRPFYYEGGHPIWVPITSPYYAGLVGHWHTYGHAYGGWYAHHGYRYQSYRGRR